MPANYVLLATQTVGNGGAASVSFANIPQTGYTDLKVVFSARSDNADDYFGLTFNGSSSSFTSRSIQGSGSSATSASRSDNYLVGTVVQSSLTANTFSNCEILIPNYTSSNFKSFSLDAVQENNATSALSELIAGLWSSNSAITSIGFVKASGNFAAGSTFYLYGLAAVGTTPVIAPFASGGDVIANDGTYWYHAFKSSGTFTTNKAISCDLLVIGGGSSGVSYYGGGGGAAGGVATATQSLSINSFTVTVGAGGAAVSYPSNANPGNNTTFAGTSNVIGYAGGAGQYTTGGSGGWGYGGTSGAPQSNAGGSSYVFSGGYNEKGGGGGGAGGTGTTPTFSPGGAAGNGGAGLNTWSSWASATATGVSGFYAGGGAGGGARDTTAGSAGSGGGGAGGAGGSGAGSAGVANTGSGGGGAGGNANSGSGGSGIVIIRYAMV